MRNKANPRQKKSEKKPGSEKFDLDSGFSSGISTFHDLSREKIVGALRSGRYLQILIGVTVAGLVLRFYHLDFNSLWLDEAATYNFARMSFVEYWNAIVSGADFNPPLFNWIEHVVLYFGNSEFALRFLPAVFGTLTVPLFYLIGKEFFDRNAGIIAAAAVAFSPFAIFYSQEARAYSMMLFFISLAFVFFLLGMRSNKPRDWTLFGFFSAIAFWTHFYALIPFIILILFALLVKVPEIRKQVRAVIPLLYAIVPFVIITIPILWVTSHLIAIRTSAAPTFGLQGFQVITEGLRAITGFNPFIMIILLILFAIGLYASYTVSLRHFLMIAVMFGAFLFISYLFAFRMPFESRFLIILLPPFFLGVSMAYRPVARITGDRRIVYGFIILLFALSIPSFVGYYSGYTKEDWRGMADIMRTEAKPGDIIVLVPSYMHLPFDYYYNNATAGTIETGASNIGELERIRESKGDRQMFMIVTSDLIAVDPSRETVSWLDTNAQYLGDYTNIYLFLA